MIRDIDKQGGCNVRRERDKPDDGSAIRWKKLFCISSHTNL